MKRCLLLSNYEKIRGMIQSDDAIKRFKAIEQIQFNFKYYIDIDKEYAWKDLLALTKDEDNEVRGGAANALGSTFQYVTDEKQAIKDLLELTKDGGSIVRFGVVDALGPAFQYVTDKKQATKDLLALTKDEDSDVRRSAALALGSAFQYVTDKEQATKDLLKLTKDKDNYVRRNAALALGSTFQYVIDKEQATKDLLKLTKDEDNYVRRSATFTFGSAFQYVTDKEQATKNLLALTKDEDSIVRRGAASDFGRAFQYFKDNKQATKDLLALTKDEDSDVRGGAASALGRAFQHMTNKVEATKVLLELINDDYSYESIHAVLSLGLAFAHVTDKEQATKTLLELTNEEDGEMRWGAAVALGAAFAHVTDKEQAMKTLLKLTKDKDILVRESANYSLGKISIYRATEAESEDELKKEMEKGIGYFEKSSQESSFINPAKFCLPFYRSYNAIIFMQENAEEEIEKNLEEAKQAVEGSESKEKLLEAVENLANALQEAQKLRGLDEIKTDLNAYRRYCDRTVEVLNETEGKAPGAAKLVRRGLPIIDKRIKEIIAEIQEKTTVLCKETKDSPLEDIGKEVNKIGQNLLRVRDPIGLEKSVNNLEIALSDICNRMVGIEKGDACELLEREKNEQYIEDKLPLMSLILSKVSSQISNKQKSGIREEIVISVGSTIFGTGVQHNITIPLQEIAYNDLKHDLKKIGSKDVFDLATLPPKLAEKVNQYIDKIKGRR